MHTISAEELLKAYNGKYKYVTQTRYGQVQLWVREPIMTDQNYRWAKIKNSDDEISIGEIAITEFQGKDWTECIYKAKPSEEGWVGKSCWFCNEYEDLDDTGYRLLDVLSKIEIVNGNTMYYPVTSSNGRYRYCRPVHPDEIIFFNDDTAEE